MLIFPNYTKDYANTIDKGLVVAPAVAVQHRYV